MKLLLTGILPHSIMEMGERLTRDGHSVSVIGHVNRLTAARAPGVIVHDIHLGDPDALRLIEAARYDAIIFFYAYQCENFAEYGSVQGAVLDSLFAMQHAARQNSVDRIVLITDRRVFGANQTGREDEIPIPDTPTGMLIKAAEDCLCCGELGNMKTLIIRVTSLYSPGDPDSLFAHAARCAKSGDTLRLDGTKDTPCDFLSADDLSVFLSAALDARAEGVAHAAYGAMRTYGETVNALKKLLPTLNAEYTERKNKCETLTGTVAHRLDFVPRHDALKELSEVIDLVPDTARRASIPAKIKGWFRASAGGVLPWAELLLLAALTWLLAGKAQTDATFRFVDFWLLYVVLIGAMHGSFMGTLSAVLACAGYAYEWALDGNGVYLLLYNPDNWLPIASYLLAGALFGYMSDKNRERVAEAERDKQESEEEARFLKTMYQQAYEDRNHCRSRSCATATVMAAYTTSPANWIPCSPSRCSSPR